MVKNRAAKLAARNIAANQDIRLPEAAYEDDRRKLRLPDGTTHDFSLGALSPRYKNDDLQRIWVAHLIREASRKGWRIFQHRGHTASEAADAVEALHAAGPALILIDDHLWVENERDTYRDMVHNAHEKLNILLSWLPDGCTAEPAPWSSAGPVREARRGPAGNAINNPHFGSYQPVISGGQVEAADAALNDLGIPEEGQRFAQLPSGLVLLTGLPGAGKTTAGLALARRAQATRNSSAYCIIGNEEAHLAPEGTAVVPVTLLDDEALAIQKARAEGADVIFINDMRYGETIIEAVAAAESGVLVFAVVNGRALDAHNLIEAAIKGTAPQRMTSARLRKTIQGTLEAVHGEPGRRSFNVWGPADTDGRMYAVKPGRETPQPDRHKPAASAEDQLKARIAFARRYAALVRYFKPSDAVKAVAKDLESMDNQACKDIASALREVEEDIRQGGGWEKSVGVLGEHLVTMTTLGTESGNLPAAMQIAAESLESDLRTGLY